MTKRIISLAPSNVAFSKSLRIALTATGSAFFAAMFDDGNDRETQVSLMGNYDSVRELAGTFKALAPLMVALDGPIARLSKHWFVLNVLRVGSVLRSLPKWGLRGRKASPFRAGDG